MKHGYADVVEPSHVGEPGDAHLRQERFDASQGLVWTTRTMCAGENLLDRPVVRQLDHTDSQPTATSRRLDQDLSAAFSDSGDAA